MDVLNILHQKQIQGTTKHSDADYPIKRIELLKDAEPIMGLSAENTVEVKHVLVVSLEFRTHDDVPGPVQEVALKVFPKGSSSFPGIILSFPIMDVPPFGLGFRVCSNTFAFDGFGDKPVHLPRYDLARRHAYNVLTGAKAQSVAYTDEITPQVREMAHKYLRDEKDYAWYMQQCYLNKARNEVAMAALESLC